MKKNKPKIFYTDSRGTREVEFIPQKSDKPKSPYNFVLGGDAKEEDYEEIQKWFDEYINYLISIKNEKK